MDIDDLDRLGPSVRLEQERIDCDWTLARLTARIA